MKNHELLRIKEHRPISAPDSPWVMQQVWKDLLFLHYKIPYDLLRNFVPPSLHLDQFEGECWISISPFKMRNVRLRYFPPIPSAYNFLELNLRTYVKYQGRPGIYFFSLDTSSTIAALAARIVFLPYFRASMYMKYACGHFNFKSYRKSSNNSATFKVAYSPSTKKFIADKGTLNYWLVERYCMFQEIQGKRIISIDIHHLQWILHKANADVSENTLAESVGFTIPDQQPIIHFAKYQKVLVWAPRLVK